MMMMTMMIPTRQKRWEQKEANNDANEENGDDDNADEEKHKDDHDNTDEAKDEDDHDNADDDNADVEKDKWIRKMVKVVIVRWWWR